MAWRPNETGGQAPFILDDLSSNEEDEVIEEEEEEEYEEEAEPSPPAAAAATPDVPPISLTPGKARLPQPPMERVSNPHLIEVAVRRLYRTDEEIMASPERFAVDEEALALLSESDQNFVLLTNELLEQMDATLLSEDFVPHSHVVGMVVEPDGRISSPAEIDGKLVTYCDLEEEIALIMEDYIECHQDDFNAAVRHFSEMILAVSGSDDDISKLKNDLHFSVSALDSHADQLRTLRQRAMKAHLMAEVLQRADDALLAESQIKKLIAKKQYVDAVVLLQRVQLILYEGSMLSIRSLQRVRDYVDSSLQTLHIQVIHDVLSSVFREDYLADAQVSPDRVFCSGHTSLAEDLTAGLSSSLSSSDALSDCIQSLMLLGKLKELHETYFARSSHAAETLVVEFVRLYDTSRGYSLPQPALSLKEPSAAAAGASVRHHSATIQAIRTQALDFRDEVTSDEEAIATIQRDSLRSFLVPLLRELKEVLRVAAELRCVAMRFLFPFLARALSEGGEAHSDKFLLSTSADWDLQAASIASEHLRPILLEALTQLASKRAPQSSAVTVATSDDKKGKGDEEQAPTVEASIFAEVIERLGKEVDEGGLLVTHAAPTGQPSSASNSSPSSSSCSTLESLEHSVSALRTMMLKQKHMMVAGSEGQLRRSEVEVLFDEFGALVSSLVREHFVKEVREELKHWSVQTLWGHLQYHVEMLFRVVCGAVETGVGGPGRQVKKKEETTRIARRMAAVGKIVEKEKNAEEMASLDRILSSCHSSGVLRMISDISPVSYRLSDGVLNILKSRGQPRATPQQQARSTQPPQRGGQDWLDHPSRTPERSGEVADSLLLLQQDVLRRWFSLSPMNLLVCYETGHEFAVACDRQVPGLLDKNGSCALFLSLIASLKSRYIPALQSFHSQSMQTLLATMSSSANGSGPSGGAAASPTAGKKEQEKGGASELVWPTTFTDHYQYPLLPCVCYVAKLVDKVKVLRKVLPHHVCQELSQTVVVSLLSDLTPFLRQKLSSLTQSTIHARLLGKSFGDAYGGEQDERWRRLCSDDLLQTHQGIDKDLYVYYQYFNAQRTSGHQYNTTRESSLPPEAYSALADGDLGVDEQLGLRSPSELSLKDDSVVVCLAVLCASAEWLADLLWQAAEDLVLVSPQERFPHVPSHGSCVPGCGGRIQWLLDSKRSSGVSTAFQSSLTQLFSIAQGALFTLSVESRWVAFHFVPQLRDESYNSVAMSSGACGFVQAYVRRVSILYALLRHHLPESKMLYTAFTASRPASELILLELAHLRDKAISPAGLRRLQTDLLVIQAAWQMVLPLNDRLREATQLSFARSVVFVRYLHNQDVAAELLSTGDCELFSNQEVEVLIRLVFRQVSGANNDSLARECIAQYYRSRGTYDEDKRQSSNTAMDDEGFSKSLRAITDKELREVMESEDEEQTEEGTEEDTEDGDEEDTEDGDDEEERVVLTPLKGAHAAVDRESKDAESPPPTMMRRSSTVAIHADPVVPMMPLRESSDERDEEEEYEEDGDEEEEEEYEEEES